MNPWKCCCCQRVFVYHKWMMCPRCSQIELERMGQLKLFRDEQKAGSTPPAGR